MTRFEKLGTDKFMAFVFRLLVSVCIIIFCSQLGRKLPSLAGLIAVMPLTGLVVLLWLYSENPGDPELMVEYTKGAMFGLVPTALFFLAAFVCFHRHLPLWMVLCVSFAVWVGAGLIHQGLIGR